MDLNKIIGKNLKFIRFQSGLSQEKFYEKYNLNSKYLACIERGEINISVNFLQKLSQILNVNIRDLITYDENKLISMRRIDSKK